MRLLAFLTDGDEDMRVTVRFVCSERAGEPQR
jgi:hypothetical protein